VNAYGASKRAGEVAVLRSGARTLVLRTQWLYSGRGPSFAQAMLDRALVREASRVVDDQVGRPTPAAAVARAAWTLALGGRQGVYHATGDGPPVSRHGLARRVFEALGVGELVTPCSTADMPSPAPRPAYAVLDLSKLGAAGVTMPDWRTALDDFVRQRTAAAPERARR
jgi:dTDP-4-dehydrorhamnose reductase